MAADSNPDNYFSSDMYSFLKQSDCLIYTALLHSTMEAYEMFK